MPAVNGGHLPRVRHRAASLIVGEVARPFGVLADTKEEKVMLEVLGAFDVPIDESARAITPQEGPEFFKEHPHLAARRGVYVFAMRAGKGITPWYVGKATRGFRGECFTLDKLLKYTIAMNKQGKGTPVLFFLALPLKKGPVNTTVVTGVETFLIRAAKARNPDLLNKQGVKAETWGISGVLRGTSGKPSTPARDFRAMMGFD